MTRQEKRTRGDSTAAAISRRELLFAAAPVGALALLGAAGVEKASAIPGDGYPRQPIELVRDVVLHAHFDLERVRELTDQRPELAKASWDWGFGDWESALGAASHTGRREIAELLIARGARPNLFTHAMLGQLDVVRSAVQARPGIQAIPGPHGITLLAHARAGGDAAKPVVAYLEEVGGADPAPPAVPLPLPLAAYAGSYAFAGSARRFEIVEHQGGLAFAVEGHTNRSLVHVGESELHPVGAPSVRLRFGIRGDEVVEVRITDGREEIVGEKTG
jgi:hypothetical protein